MAEAQDKREYLSGPLEAQVLRVVDGDTIAVRARIWLGQEVETMVRVRGLDTPEKNGRCEPERELARRATAFVEERLAQGTVILRDLGNDKYGGRVVARVQIADGADLTEAVMAAGLGHSYDGGRKQPWCDGKGP